ncbi:MAG: rhodanese-like domain-containing protein [Bacteroidales bacterium]
MKFKILLTFIVFSFTIHLSGQIDSKGEYISVGPEDFLTLIRFQENAVLIDVRLPFEYRKGHIENSINIPIKLSPKKFIRKVEQFPKESVLLLYCESDVRSISAARKLYDAGYKKIYILEGGIIAWKRKLLPLYRKKGLKTNQ